MEIVISVSEAELEEFPEEEAPESSGQQEQVWQDIACTRYCKKFIIHQCFTHPRVAGEDKKGQNSLSVEVYSRRRIKPKASEL